MAITPVQMPPTTVSAPTITAAIAMARLKNVVYYFGLNERP
jgi:hypothetical protein